MAIVQAALAAGLYWSGQPHFEFGIVPGDGVNLLRPEVMDSIRGRYFILTRQLLDAPTAKDWGVVHEIVPVDRLLARAQEIADGIAALPPLTAATPGSHSAKSCAASSRRDWATAVLEGISAADVARAAAQNKRARSA